MHTHKPHISDRWPIEIISEPVCGCYDNQCSLGFYLAMWQGLWRQPEAESVAESVRIVKGLWESAGCWTSLLRLSLLLLLSLRLLLPGAAGAWTTKPHIAAWGNQLALYTPELCVIPACGGFPSPLNLLQLCLRERLLMDPGKECEVTSSHAFQAVSGMWLDVD